MADSQLGMFKNNETWEEEAANMRAFVQCVNVMEPRPRYAVAPLGGRGATAHVHDALPHAQQAAAFLTEQSEQEEGRWTG